MKNILVIIGLSIITLTVNAKKLSIQDRLLIIEQKVENQASNNTNTSDIIMQNQALQQQIAELKGTIEEQNHQIKSLQEKQKLLYIDVDSRLATLESKLTQSNASQPIVENNTAQPTTQSVPQNNTTSQVETVVVDTNTQEPVTTTEIIKPQLSTYQDAYDISFAHLRAGRFLESARAFENFIQGYPENELTDDAYYWLGESYYVKRQYPQALAAFKSLTDKYPNSKKAADAWLKTGYSYYEMDDLVKADEVLNSVINNYPNTGIARLARNRLLQLQRDN